MGAGSAVGEGMAPEPEERNSPPEEAAGDQAGAGAGTERKMEIPEREEPREEEMSGNLLQIRNTVQPSDLQGRKREREI